MIAASELHLPAAAARQTSSRGACTCSPGLALEVVFLNVYGAQELIPRMNSASLCSLAGQYDNPIPTRFLAPIDFLKIPALESQVFLNTLAHGVGPAGPPYFQGLINKKS
jgi:hypothetical protein